MTGVPPVGRLQAPSATTEAPRSGAAGAVCSETAAAAGVVTAAGPGAGASAGAGSVCAVAGTGAGAAAVDGGADLVAEVSTVRQKSGSVDANGRPAGVASPINGAGVVGILVTHQDSPPGVTPPAATNSAGASRVNYTSDPWGEAKRVIGDRRVTLGPTASQQWLEAPDHLAMVLARYRAAAALIGDSPVVAEFGSGEGSGARILAKGRARYVGIDGDGTAVSLARETFGNERVAFAERDLTTPGVFLPMTWFDAVVSLDVIEHIPADREGDFMDNAVATRGPQTLVPLNNAVGSLGARFAARSRSMSASFSASNSICWGYSAKPSRATCKARAGSRLQRKARTNITYVKGGVAAP